MKNDTFNVKCQGLLISSLKFHFILHSYKNSHISAAIYWSEMTFAIKKEIVKNKR